MGGLPTSKKDLEAAGYLFDFETHCRACGAPIEFWITKTGAKMPMDVVAAKETDNFFSPVKEFKRIPHWASCPNAKEFRRSRK